MRIAVDMHFLQDKQQGIKTCLEGLYKAVCQKKPRHDFTFIFSAPDEISESWEKYGDVAFVGVGGRNRRLSYAMGKVIKELGHLDLSHFSAVAPAFVPGKVMVTIHDILFLTHPEYFHRKFRWQQKAALSWTLRRADLVTTISNYTYETIDRLFPNFSGPVNLLPNGVNHCALSVNKASARDFVKDRYGLTNYILTVGRIDPRKNHKNMLQAFQLLAEKVRADDLPAFVIVGNVDNNYREGARLIEQAAERLPVVWLSDVDNWALKRLYEAALWVVMASYAEGFGLPILEAMAAATPVIAAKNTAMPEVLGDCGLLIDARNPASIESAYRKMLMSKDFRQNCSDSGYKRASLKTWDHCAEAYLSMLDEI